MSVGGPEQLATALRLSADTAETGLGPVTSAEMLAMLDWLLGRQRHIERSLANRRLGPGALILYDLPPSFLERRCCPLAALGHNRDAKKITKQIVFGLLCAADGCPVAVEVFAGNTADPSTLGTQMSKIRERFGIGHAVRWLGARLRGRDRISRRVGREANRRNVEKIQAEARLDGIYIVRSIPDEDTLGASEAVEAEMSLATVERALRSIKTACNGFPVHTMDTLLTDLATLTLNQVTPPGGPQHVFSVLARPPPQQHQACELLEIDPGNVVPTTLPVRNQITC